MTQKHKTINLVKKYIENRRQKSYARLEKRPQSGVTSQQIEKNYHNNQNAITWLEKMNDDWFENYDISDHDTISEIFDYALKGLNLGWAQ